MSLLDNASLLLTPNAYKEGKLYSVIPSNGNGDFTATRATTATRVNAEGLVDLVPYNLASYSEVFSNAAWTKLNSSTITANTTTAPNGTLTADTFTASNLAFGGILRQTLSVTSGIAHTFSFFAKKDNYRYVGIRINTSVNGQRFPNYDFDTDTLNTQGVAGATLSRELLPNGWVKLILTFTTTTTAGNPDIALTTANGDTSTALSGGQSIFIWGAQLVEGTSARDYLRTETRLNIPRVDYSLGGCPNILLEPQRTNLCNYSTEFNDSTFWIRTGSVVVNANTSISPSGTLTADTIIGATGTGGWATANVLQRSLPLSSSTTYFFTVYLKGSGSVTIQLRDQTTGNLTSLVCNLTSSWQRFELTRTTTSAPSTGLGIIFGSATGNFDAWGAQLEAGAYSTSFIPTTTASVTRNADSISRNNIFTNGLITAAGGTWFVELRNNRVLTRDGSGVNLYISTNNTATDGFFFAAGTNQRLNLIKNPGFNQLYLTTTDTVKLAIKWNGTTADVFANGVKVVNATSFTITALQFIGCDGGGVPKYINEMALFPTPLTDAQCLALTA